MRRVNRHTFALPTDQPTHTASYRGALAHIKSVKFPTAQRCFPRKAIMARKRREDSTINQIDTSKIRANFSPVCLNGLKSCPIAHFTDPNYSASPVLTRSQTQSLMENSTDLTAVLTSTCYSYTFEIAYQFLLHRVPRSNHFFP